MAQQEDKKPYKVVVTRMLPQRSQSMLEEAVERGEIEMVQWGEDRVSSELFHSRRGWMGEGRDE